MVAHSVSLPCEIQFSFDLIRPRGHSYVIIGYDETTRGIQAKVRFADISTLFLEPRLWIVSELLTIRPESRRPKGQLTSTVLVSLSVFQDAHRIPDAECP
jgi:hypothetical protein